MHMEFDNNLNEISAKIQLLKKTAVELKKLGENFRLWKKYCPDSSQFENVRAEHFRYC